jgi:hypothetical protein
MARGMDEAMDWVQRELNEIGDLVTKEFFGRS